MRKTTILIVFNALLFFCSLNCLAQKINSRPKNEDNVAVIPFRFINSEVKMPQVRIKINGKLIWAVFDTGFDEECIMSQSMADNIGLKYDRSVLKRLINGVSMDYLVSKNQKYEIMGDMGQVAVETESIEVLILPDKYFGFAKDRNYGEEFSVFINIGTSYDDYKVQLDYIKNVIRIIPFDIPLDTSKSIIVDYDHDGLPWINVKNSQKKVFRALIDTGAVWSQFPVEFDRNAYMMGMDSSSINISEINRGRLGKVDIVVDEFKFSEVEALISGVDRRKGSILGSSFLDNKVITLDSRSKRAYIESLVSDMSEKLVPFTGKVEGVFKVKLPNRDKKLQN